VKICEGSEVVCLGILSCNVFGGDWEETKEFDRQNNRTKDLKQPKELKGKSVPLQARGAHRVPGCQGSQIT